MTINDLSKDLNRRWWSQYDESIKRTMKAKRQLELAPVVSHELAEITAQLGEYIDKRIDAFQTGKILCNFPKSWVPMYKESQK
jgi:hypothetical protein